MDIMMSVIRPYPASTALLTHSLATGTESKQEVSIPLRNMVDSLSQAVADCRFTRVRFFFVSGMSANLTNDRGYNLLVTSLHIDDDKKRDIMFQYLLKRGVDCCNVDTKTGRDVLSWACLLGRHVQVAHIMETAIGELNFTMADKQGMTALHLATIHGHLEVVRLLIAAMNKYRLSVDVTDKQGLTPFIYAKRLGHFAIAEVLLREGHCSPKQFDDVMYKSVEDWVQIGTRERSELNKQQYKEIMAQNKILGKTHWRMSQKSLNKYKYQVSVTTLSDEVTDSIHRSTLRAQINNKETLRSDQLNPRQSVRHFRNGVTGPQLENVFLSELHSRSKGQLFTSPKPEVCRERNSTTLPQISEGRMASPGEIFQAMHHKSMNTAFALLDVQANQSSEIVHAAQFVHSQLDTSKVTECSGMMGCVTSMMDILSEQQSGAFRVVAKPTSPPVVPEVNTNVPKKKNVSTLALIFGKNNTPRRYRPAAKANKQRSKTTEHAKAKKQKLSIR